MPDKDGYATTLAEKRRSALTSAGTERGLELAADLPIGDHSIGFYDPATKRWSKPNAEKPAA